MSPSELSQLEDRVAQLSIDEQLLLIAHITRRLSGHFDEKSAKENQLAMMAADPQIQREIRQIDAEFSSAEADGLENK